jgi:3-oxoadipate enol-lactonase
MQLGLSPKRERETIEQMARKSRASYEAATRATWTGDYCGDLGAIRAPTLVMVGERDSVAPRALSEEIAAGIPRARFVELSAAGHVANADAPEAFNAELRAFLEGIAET